MQYAVLAFLKNRKAQIIEEGDGLICFEQDLIGLRNGCAIWADMQSVWIQFTVEDVSDAEYAIAQQVTLSVQSTLLPYESESGGTILAWQHSPQNLPWSARGVKQVLEPIFDKAECEIAKVLTAIRFRDLQRTHALTSEEIMARLNAPVGYA